MARHKEEINFYKQFAKKYDERGSSAASRLYYDYWDKLLLDNLPKKQQLKILDLGCGTGGFLNKLKKKYQNVTGIDISPEMLKIARKKYSHLSGNLIEGTAENLPFKKNSLDVVFIRGALHHFQNPRQSLQEICRVLKKGGLLIFLEPCSDFFILRLLRKLIFKFKSKKFLSQHHSFTKKEIEDLLFAADFKVKSYQRLGLLAYPLCARPDIFPLITSFPSLKYLVSFLIKVDEFIIKFLFFNRVSLLIIFYAQKR